MLPSPIGGLLPDLNSKNAGNSGVFQNPLQGNGPILTPIINKIKKTLQPIINNPDVQQMIHSPVGALVQGKPLSYSTDYTKQHPYNPQIMISGEMETTPGMGSYIRNPKTGKMSPNTNPQEATYSIKQPDTKSGFTKEELAQNRKQLPNISPDQPIPEKPSYAKPPKLAKNQVVSQKLNGIDSYQLPQTYGGNRVSLENTDKSVMANDIGGNTFDNVLEKLPAAKQKIWSETEQMALRDPTPVNVQNGLMPYLKKYLDQSVIEGKVQPEVAQNALDSYYSRLLNHVKLSNPNDPQATAIDMSNPVISKHQLLLLNKSANDLSSSAYNDVGALKNGLNPQQQVNVSLSDGVNDALTNALPQAKTNMLKYGSMKRIGDNISKEMRNQSLTIGLHLPGTGITLPVIPGSGLVRQGAAAVASGNPLALGIVGAGLGVAGLKAFENGLPGELADTIADIAGYSKNGVNNNPNSDQTQTQDPKNYQVSDNTQHTVQDIPLSQDQVKPDKNGDYLVMNPSRIIGPDGGSLAVNPQEYQQQTTANNNKIADLTRQQAKAYGNKYLQDQLGAQIESVKAQQSSLDTKNQTSKELLTGYNLTNSLENASNKTRKFLQGVSPNYFSGIPTLDALRSSTDSKYSALKTQLSIIESKYPISISGKLNKESLMSALDTVNNQFVWDWNQALGTYVGPQSSPQPQALQQGISSSPSLNQLPSATSTNGTLPPIPQGNGGWSQAFTPDSGIQKNLNFTPGQ